MVDSLRGGARLGCAGGKCSRGLIWYVDGYDKLSRAAVIRKYGRGRFEESEKEALKNGELSAAARAARD